MPHASPSHSILEWLSGWSLCQEGSTVYLGFRERRLPIWTHWYLLISALRKGNITCVNIFSTLFSTRYVHFKDGRQQACQSCQFISLRREKWSHLADSFRKTNLTNLNSQTLVLLCVLTWNRFTNESMPPWEMAVHFRGSVNQNRLVALAWWEAKLVFCLASTTLSLTFPLPSSHPLYSPLTHPNVLLEWNE